MNVLVGVVNGAMKALDGRHEDKFIFSINFDLYLDKEVQNLFIIGVKADAIYYFDERGLDRFEQSFLGSLVVVILEEALLLLLLFTRVGIDHLI